MGAKKDLKYYLGLKWSYTVEEEDKHKGKKFFIIRVNELPGVVTDGETIEEAMSNIKEAIFATIELYLKQGDPTNPEKELQGKDCL
jgi:predicted RNase H-like HicB family nuclease